MKKQKESKEHIPVRFSVHSKAKRHAQKLGIPLYQMTEQALEQFMQKPEAVNHLTA